MFSLEIYFGQVMNLTFLTVPQKFSMKLPRNVFRAKSLNKSVFWSWQKLFRSTPLETFKWNNRKASIRPTLICEKLLKKKSAKKTFNILAVVSFVTLRIFQNWICEKNFCHLPNLSYIYHVGIGLFWPPRVHFIKWKALMVNISIAEQLR